MSEPTAPVEPHPVERTRAVTRRGRWPGWIWAVPIAAVGIVIWLLVRQLSARGVEITVTFEDAAQMDPDNTKVIMRGVQVGKVAKVRLSEEGTGVQVTLHIDKPEEKFLRSGTRFYLQGAEPSLSDLSSLKAIVGGPNIQMMPGGGAATRHFAGLMGKAPQRLSVAVPYEMTFTGDAGNLKAGAPVMLRGFMVGEVTQVALSVRPASGEIDTRVEIALDPLRFRLQPDPSEQGDWSRVMNTAVSALIAHGTRGRLTQSPPLVGAPQIELVQAAASTPTTLTGNGGGPPEIPTVEGGGLEHFVSAVGDLPIQQIGDNVRTITQQLKDLTGSPQLRQSLAHLNDSLSQLDRTLKEVGPQIGPAVQSARQTIDRLKQTADSLDQAVKAARDTIGANPAAPDGSLQPTLLHVSEAARSIRVLADYLDQHPEALIKGRLNGAH